MHLIIYHFCWVCRRPYPTPGIFYRILCHSTARINRLRHNSSVLWAKYTDVVVRISLIYNRSAPYRSPGKYCNTPINLYHQENKNSGNYNSNANPYKDIFLKSLPLLTLNFSVFSSVENVKIEEFLYFYLHIFSIVFYLASLGPFSITVWLSIINMVAITLRHRNRSFMRCVCTRITI